MSDLYKDEPIYEHAKTEKEKFKIVLGNLSKESFKVLKPDVRKVVATIDNNTGKMIQ